MEVGKGKTKKEQNLKILGLLVMSAKYTCSKIANRVKNRIREKKVIGAVEHIKIVIIEQKV